MSVYTILKFLHVSGDIGIFVGVGIQLLCLAVLRRLTRVEQARVIARLIAIADPVGVISSLLTIATGLYMTRTVWGFQVGWIIVALASIGLFITPIIMLVIEPRMRAIMSIARGEPDGPLKDYFYANINDPVLGTALQAMAVLLLGIVFLMTNKPSLVDSVIAIAVALVIGLASGAPLFWSRWGRIRYKSKEA